MSAPEEEEDDTFYEEDEPLSDLLIDWDNSEKHLTAPSCSGTGWCAPSS